MIGDFNARNLIGSQVTLGKVLLCMPAFLAGYVIARPRVRAGVVQAMDPLRAVLAGAGSGALAGGLTIATVAMVKSFSPNTVHDMWIAVTPALLDIITFGQSVPVAAVILILAGAALGGAGAVLRSSPDKYRRPVSAGLLATFMMALLQRIIPTILIELAVKVGSGSPQSWSQWLYSRTFGGLTKLGAVIVFVTGAAASAAWSRQGRSLRQRVESLATESRQFMTVGVALALLGVLIVLPILAGTVVSLVLGTVGIFLLMGLGLNIV